MKEWIECCPPCTEGRHRHCWNRLLNQESGCYWCSRNEPR